MASPLKPWETNLHNSTQIINAGNPNSSICRTPMRSAPVLPPRPTTNPSVTSYLPSSYGGYGGGSYGGYGGAGMGYSSYSMPYRSSMYGSFGGGYSGVGMGMYGMTGMAGYPTTFAPDDAERRFVQYAEESSRNTFANVESVVRAFNSIAMMLDNTFFAMTSSFRAVLSVAENFGRLRTMFGHIWYSINVFRLLGWMYRKLMYLLGIKVHQNATSVAWNQAARGAAAAGPEGAPKGANWPTLAFLGVLLSAPYIISKFLPKYEDKSDPVNWKSPGVKAKAVFDFVANSPGELTVHVNDSVVLAPTYVQEEMRLKNSGWAFAVCNGRSGVVPLNYLVLGKGGLVEPSAGAVPVPNGVMKNGSYKTHTKRVSFGENQIFENVDLEDYYTGKKGPIFDNKTLKGKAEGKVGVSGDGGEQERSERKNSVVTIESDIVSSEEKSVN